MKNPKNSKYENMEPLTKRISNTIFKVILKQKNHPSAVAARNSDCEFQSLCFKINISKKRLNRRKATQSTDISVEILKGNEDIFADYIRGCFNKIIINCKFSSVFKQTKFTPVIK